MFKHEYMIERLYYFTVYKDGKNFSVTQNNLELIVVFVVNKSQGSVVHCKCILCLSTMSTYCYFIAYCFFTAYVLQIDSV